MAEAEPKRRFALPREIRILLSVGLLVFVFEFLVVPQLAGARRSLHLLSTVNPVLVAVGVVLQVLSLWCYAELTRAVLYPYSPSRYNATRVTLAGHAISHVLPGGTAPAGALSYRILSELGVPKETTAFGLATEGAGSAVVLNAIFWVALIVSIPLRGFNPAYGFAALAGVFLLGAFFGTILLITRGQRHADLWLRALAKRVPAINPDRVAELLAKVAARVAQLIDNRQALWRAFAWAALNWLLDAACLFVFVWAFGTVVSPVDLLVAYGLANVLAAIPITPSGLGIVEATLITTLVGFGVPHAQAILAVLSYRLVNFWLPIPFGGLAYASLQWRREPTRATPATGPETAPGA